MTSTPAGWHPDPSAHGQLRYWDGIGWVVALVMACMSHQRAIVV